MRALAILLALTLALPAWAQEGRALGIELNRADSLDAGCRLTFVLSNALGRDIDSLVAETVLFSNDGEVLLLTLFDFGAVPARAPRVRQFEVPDIRCDAVAQVLVNGLSSCAAGGAPLECAAALRLESRVDGVALVG